MGIVIIKGRCHDGKILTCNQIELAYNDEGQGIPIILIHGLDGNLSGFQDLKMNSSNHTE